jgi:predicted membrane channel-forming protein YqfA (hemolysin III family)
VYSFSSQIVTYKSLAIVISAVLIPFIVLMLNEGTFWGLVGIAGVFAGLGIPYLIIYYKRTSKFQDMTNFLTRLVLMQIDEKIAVLDTYVLVHRVGKHQKQLK